MNALHALMVCLALLVWENALWADDTGIEQPKYAPYANCHGIEGNNKELPGPNIAGQNRAYLIKQVNLFRDNIRIHPVLSTAGLEIAAGGNFYCNWCVTSLFQVQLNQFSRS